MESATTRQKPASGWKRWTPNGVHLAWGLGSLGTITMINSISAIYLFFLVSVVGMSPLLAGSLIFVSKVVDMVSDPVMGWISDRTNTRWGRRRPYMFVASFACAGSMILLFSVPSEPGLISTPTYVVSALCIYALSLTAFNVPYLAMPAEMTDDYHERSTIMSYRAVFLVGGGFVGSAVAGLFLREFGGGAEAYQLVGYFLASVAFISMITAAIGTNKAKFTSFTRPSIPRINQIKLFLINKPFLILGAIKAIQFLQLAASSAVTLFFFISVLEKDEGLLFPFGSAVIAGSVLSLRPWLSVIKRFGKRETFALALVAQAFVYMTWLLATPQEPLEIFILRAFLMGVLSGATLICGQSMITDTIEYDRRISGIYREGMYSSVFSFIEKSTHAAGPLLIGILLTWFGFDNSVPRGEPQPASAIAAIEFGQIWIPVICSFLMAIGLYFYDLDEEKLVSTGVHDLGQKDGYEATG